MESSGRWRVQTSAAFSVAEHSVRSTIGKESKINDPVIKQFAVDFAKSDIADLNSRLDNTRWPDAETVDDWEQGVPLSEAQSLVRYWRNDYDWYRCQERLNALPQFSTTIDGVEIYFIHVRSPVADSSPLLLTHGWPGSVLEFVDCIAGLTDPVAHGGKPEDAFDVIIPALPGYGLSGKPTVTGWGVEKIADCWAELMSRLGYSQFMAQGGDFGAPVTVALARQHPERICSIHLNLVMTIPEDLTNPSAEEQQVLNEIADQMRSNGGYLAQQSSRPQTLGYGLADSPVGQAMWIYEKFRFWTDCNGDPTSAIGIDPMLDNITLYWLTNSGTSAARLYWESLTDAFGSALDVPTGVSIFPHEIVRPLRAWAEEKFTNILYWGNPERGGHFAAWEQPEIFVAELRGWGRAVRAHELAGN